MAKISEGLDNLDINIDIEDNATIKMVFFVSSNYSYNLNINLKRDSSLELYTSDKNSGDSVVNYISSISNKEIMNMNKQKNENICNNTCIQRKTIY